MNDNKGYINGSIRSPVIPVNHYLCEMPTLDKDVRIIFRRRDSDFGHEEHDDLKLIIQDKEEVKQIITLNPEYRKALAFWLLGNIRQ